MGFIIWYKVVFREEKPGGGIPQVSSALPLGTSLPLQVSNDVFSGKYILDADIELKMVGGAIADAFTIKLTNLPSDAAEALKNKQSQGAAKGQPLLVDIYLGYFDDDSSKTAANQTMTGAVTSVQNTVSNDGLLETLVKGQELGGYKLRTKCNISIAPQDQITADAIVKEILKGTGVGSDNSHLDQQFENYTLKEINGLEALHKFTSDKNGNVLIPLVVRDNTLYIGPSVGRDEAPVHFSPDLNIVKLNQRQDNEEDDEPCQSSENGQVKNKPTTILDVTVLGHPGLRVGQKVILDVDGLPKGTFRINQLTHTFSTRSGYICQATVVVVDPGKVAPGPGGAHGLIGNLRNMAEKVQKPAIDVGQVKKYEAGNQQKHRATLNYGQSVPANAATPSVDVKVDETTQLLRKPIVSPFAWHKCGLIVPVYPGMRALLAHNFGLVDDAVVAGFLWSEQPKYDRPKNQDGDYWLCLPTELDGNDQPTGKGANDLIDKTGLRVIEVKGLRIVVGGNTSDVGERPEVPEAKTIVIEHESGTTIKVANDGAVSITTKSKDISLTNGSVTLKLGSSGVEVS